METWQRVPTEAFGSSLLGNRFSASTVYKTVRSSSLAHDDSYRLVKLSDENANSNIRIGRKGFHSPSQKLANSHQITSPMRLGYQNSQPAPAMRRYVPRNPVSARKRPGDEQWRTELCAARRARAEELESLGLRSSCSCLGG